MGSFSWGCVVILEVEVFRGVFVFGGVGVFGRSRGEFGDLTEIVFVGRDIFFAVFISFFILF